MIHCVNKSFGVHSKQKNSIDRSCAMYSTKQRFITHVRLLKKDRKNSHVLSCIFGKISRDGIFFPRIFSSAEKIIWHILSLPSASFTRLNPALLTRNESSSPIHLSFFYLSTSFENICTLKRGTSSRSFSNNRYFH